MKLRNLLFGTMIACVFAACSNEDDPIVGPDQPQTGENNATLTISVKNVARSLTKAAAEGTQTENEAKITNLTVALYDAETGALVASTSDIANEDAAADNDEVQFAGLTEGAQLRAIAFANMPEISLAGTTIDNFVSPVYTMPAAGFAENYLPMSSGLSDPFTLQAGKNYYGYTKTAGEGEHILVADPLYLIRNVARIDFTGLSLDMTRAAKDVYVEGIRRLYQNVYSSCMGGRSPMQQIWVMAIAGGMSLAIPYGVMCPQLMLLMLQIMLQVIEEIS